MARFFEYSDWAAKAEAVIGKEMHKIHKNNRPGEIFIVLLPVQISSITFPFPFLTKCSIHSAHRQSQSTDVLKAPRTTAAAVIAGRRGPYYELKTRRAYNAIYGWTRVMSPGVFYFPESRFRMDQTFSLNLPSGYFFIYASRVFFALSTVF